MDAFTITEMHYLMVSLFCELVWPLYLFALAELNSVAVLFALFYKHSIGTNWEIAPCPCPNPDRSMTALTFQRPNKVSIISQVCTVALSKCTRIKRKLGMGVVMAFVLP